MTILPTGYNPNELHPRVIITNLSGGAAYTYESVKLNATPTQDFKLQALKLHLGVENDFGHLQLLIHDHDNAFTDLTNNRRPGVIGREWGVQLYLGKSSGTVERWFYGKIKDFSVGRPQTGVQAISLTCVGWGVILRERMSRLTRNQDKQSDGVSLDDNDTKTKISELLLDLFQDVDHYVDDNITKIGNITVSTVSGGGGTGIDEDATSGKVANVNYTVASFAQIISDLCSIANTTWHINADRALIVQDPEAVDSGFLFSNDFTATSDLTNWSATKMGYLLNAPLEWQDSSADMLYNFIHGFGHFNPTLSSSDGGTPDASDNLDSEYHAIPITPTTDNISKIAIRAIKTGTPATDGSVEIWGDTGGSGPDPNDIRRKIILNKTTLQGLGTSTPANWFEIPIKPKLDVTPNEQLYIVFPKYGDVSNTFNVNYEAGSGTYWDSTDGTSWTSRTGKSAFRVYDARRLVTTVENIDATALLPEPRERIFPIRADLEEQTVRETLLQAASFLGKQKRTYGRVVVSPTTSRIPLGTKCRLQDVKTGLDVYPTIKTVDLEANTDTLGVQRIELGLESYRR